MLKIKDNVNLKELEKFGFEYDDVFGKYKKVKNGTEGIFVQVWNRKIYMLGWRLLDTIYDLIKADMVEVCDAL